MRNFIFIIIIAGCLAFALFRSCSKFSSSLDKGAIFNPDAATTDKILEVKEKRQKQIEALQEQNKRRQQQRVRSYE